MLANAIRSVFPLRAPRLGLSFDDVGVHAVQVRRRWSGPPWELISARQQRLEEGLLRPSATHSNIGHPTLLAEQIRRSLPEHLFGAQGIPVAVSLPDACARVALLYFESWPDRADDREPLIRLRLEQECISVPPGTRLCYRLYPTPARDSASGMSVLVCSVGKEILAEYEGSCLAGGLIPVTIGLSSFHVIDLFRMTIESKLSKATEIGCAFMTPETFAFVIFRQGRPVFLRLKQLGTSRTTDVRDELVASLLFYKERMALGSGMSRDQLPVFLLGTTESMLDVAVVETLNVQPHVLTQPDRGLRTSVIARDGVLTALAAVCRDGRVP